MIVLMKEYVCEFNLFKLFAAVPEMKPQGMNIVVSSENLLP
jgi:hypothetical protein